uniref:Sodium/calcium exchanger membrane region domain-containing protein n=1 Tax=Strigamia maritima TaxID=126957 RepID=T1J5C6_STRMM
MLKVFWRILRHMEPGNEHLLRNAPTYFKTTEECAISGENETEFIRQFLFIYCDFNNNFTALGLIIYLTWLIFLFVTIGTVVDHFFCPCLEFISKTLTLSQNVAGVTFLAFGNGAPEIFSSVAGAKVQRSNLVIAGLFGSAMFLTCIVAGTIMLMMPPFQMVEKPFLRDVIFFTVVAFWTYVCLYYKKITLLMALSFIGVYCLYTAYVLIAHHVYQKYLKGKEQVPLLDHFPAVPSTIALHNSTEATLMESPIATIPPVLESDNIDTQSQDIAPWVVPPILRHWDSGEHHVTTNLLDDFDLFLEDDEEDPYDKGTHAGPLTSSMNETVIRISTPGTLMLFLYGICPVNYHFWPISKWWNKLLQTLRAPIVLLLKLTIPIVTCEEHQLHNWCRPLYALHCTATPLFCLFASGLLSTPIYAWIEPWMLVLVVGFVFSIATLVFTVNNVPPRFLVFWAFLGFIGSVGWMFFIAKAIVSLLTTFGKIMKLSDEILGLTILSWGNGIPDFIADVTVAKSGYPQMGISACFGGPLIIVLLGMGISFTIGTAESENQTLDITYGKMTTIFCAFLCASLLSALIIFPLMQFRTHKFYGMYLMCLYLLFIVCAMMHEFELLIYIYSNLSSFTIDRTRNNKYIDIK